MRQAKRHNKTMQNRWDDNRQQPQATIYGVIMGQYIFFMGGHMQVLVARTWPYSLDFLFANV